MRLRTAAAHAVLFAWVIVVCYTAESFLVAIKALARTFGLSRPLVWPRRAAFVVAGSRTPGHCDDEVFHWVPICCRSLWNCN